VESPKHPCQPSPCGPNSHCRESNGHAVCSCRTEFIGVPPNCRPECVVSAECPLDKSCINQRCKDPCPGTCGTNAKCRVVNHNPICSCVAGHTGDPFGRCYRLESKPPLPSFKPYLKKAIGFCRDQIDPDLKIQTTHIHFFGKIFKFYLVVKIN